jgi:hypothetical protein
MDRNTKLQMVRVLAAAAVIAMSGSALAHGGGGGGGFSGGDSGDSSMNPFTGDSYAYFHGGHNLGEQGTIRPNRPNPAWIPGRRFDPNRAAANARASDPRGARMPNSDVDRWADR